MALYMGTRSHARYLQELVLKYSRPRSPRVTDERSKIVSLPDIEVVVFDVYGTLLTSGLGEISSAEPSQISAATEVRKLYFPNAPISDHDLVASLRQTIESSHSASRSRGISIPEVEIREIWSSLFSEMQLTSIFSANDLIEEFALVYELLSNPAWPMPGSQAVLSALLSSPAFDVAVISNAQFYTPVILEVFFGSATADKLTKNAVWSYKTGQAKPSRELFSQLIRRFPDIENDRFVYIGNDMLNDIQGAAEAGMKTVLFAGDADSLRLRVGDSRVTVSPDSVITRLTDIPLILGRDRL